MLVTNQCSTENKKISVYCICKKKHWEMLDLEISLKS